jgi:uncharacterized protein YfaS (alpha-2-macroglobulin family)
MRTKETQLTLDVVTAIHKYGIMLETATNTPTEIKFIYDKLTSPRASVLDDMPRVHNPQAGEERLVASIDLINAMQERFQKAQVFIAWFEPMWKALSEDEREILETYKYGYRNNREMQSFAAEHNQSVSQAYRDRLKAVEHLHSLLYGC